MEIVTEIFVKKKRKEFTLKIIQIYKHKCIEDR